MDPYPCLFVSKANRIFNFGKFSLFVSQNYSPPFSVSKFQNFPVGSACLLGYIKWNHSTLTGSSIREPTAAAAPAPAEEEDLYRWKQQDNPQLNCSHNTPITTGLAMNFEHWIVTLHPFVIIFNWKVLTTAHFPMSLFKPWVLLITFIA